MAPAAKTLASLCFGVVALDDADAAERLGEAAGDLGVDLGALAEDGSNGLEGLLQDEAEDDQDDEGDERHLDAELDEVGEGEERGEQAAEEVDDAGADEVADAFDIGHDAGDEGAGAVLVVEGYGQAADVGLDLHAEFGDEALALFREELGEGEGGDALNDGGDGDRADDPGQNVELMLPHDVVDEVAGGSRQDKTAGAVDDHQQEAAAEEQAAGFDQLPDLGEDLLQLGLRPGFGEIGCDCAARATGGPVGGLHAVAEAGLS